MPAPLTPSAGKTHALNRPSTRVHESPSPAVEPQHSSPSHPNVSPLRKHHYHLSSSASSSAGVAGRHGCVLPSHHSFVSLTHPSQGNGGVGAGGTHGGHSNTLSLASTEMQEYLSMASPASDFYYYSPQQHYYLEPSMPYAAAELYGRGSPCLNSFSASTPSRVSNLSLSGPRFPQWYLPRGMYASSSAFLPSGGPIPSSVLYGNPSPYHHATSATASVSADEDAMSCENGGGGSVAVVSRQPPVQRLTPQPSASAVTAFALPPAMASMERGSSAATPPHSPRYAAGQTPHFVSFDGRAYGLPVYGFYNTPDSAAGQQQQQQLVPPRGDATAASGSDGGANGSSRRGPLRRLEVVAEVPVTALPSRGRPGQAADAAAAMDGGAEGDEEDVYSPQEKALLVDAHARLARLRSKALDEQEEQQRALAAYSAPSSPTAASTHAEESSAARRHQRLSRKAGASAAAQRSASAQSTADDGEIPISPIAPLVGADSADATRLDDSMADAEEDTRAVLERVLSVPGVKWRHDPYSRRVLPARPSSGSSLSESDGGDGQRQRAPQLDSEPASPDAAAQRSASIRTRPVSAAARHAPSSTSASTSAGSSVLSAHERSGVTQPPAASSTPSQTRLSGRDDSVSSAKAPQQQQQQSRLAQHSDSEAERQKQPSARRVPIKKVCVRHFVSGHGDSTSSTDAAVGLLTTVITPASAVSREVAQAASHETSARSTASASLSASSCVERESPAGTVAEAAQKSVRSADRVPQPRSKAKQLSETAAAAPHVVTAVSSSSNSSCNHNQPEQSAPHTYVDATAPSAVAAVPLWRTAQHLPSPFGSSSSVAPTAAAAALSWARRLRTQAEDAVAGQHAEHGGMRSQEAARLRGAVASTDDLDTSDLVRMWQRLGAAGYFRDVLAAREWKLGADSNSSTRAVGRNGARRSGSRQHQQGGARGGESPNKLQMAMLTEREVTHVYVLRHRYRTSCAVAASLFEPGTAVVVDGDMGVDTGVVALAITRAEFDALTPRERSLAGLAMQLSHAMMATIHRQALPEEMSLRTSVQMPLEDATLDFVRFLCTQPHLFSSCQIDLMEFVSVEFQADGQKLYVHYKAHASVRFLELATYLNHIFHCRIWMKLARDTWEA